MRIIILLLVVMPLVAVESCSSRNRDPEQRVIHADNKLSSKAPADTGIIKTHLKMLTKTSSFRTYANVEQLDQTAEYIRNIFARSSQDVIVQEFSADGKSYKNIIASFGPKNASRIIIGAHYDVYGPHEGADDNASGVTGLLELARMLQEKVLTTYRIDLVAYALEEPPYFRTTSMGSYVHARSLYDDKVSVYGMVSLEMIGYFSDAKGSQSYPEEIPPGYFGDKGDYIALVTRIGGGVFQKKFCAAFTSAGRIKSNQYSGLASTPGIDFSDHLNYWIFNFDAMMITDTSFYRNPNYHKAGDTLETLDLERMARVIDGVYESLITLTK